MTSNGCGLRHTYAAAAGTQHQNRPRVRGSPDGGNKASNKRAGICHWFCPEQPGASCPSPQPHPPTHSRPVLWSILPRQTSVGSFKRRGGIRCFCWPWRSRLPHCEVGNLAKTQERPLGTVVVPHKQLARKPRPPSYGYREMNSVNKPKEDGSKSSPSQALEIRVQLGDTLMSAL